MRVRHVGQAVLALAGGYLAVLAVARGCRGHVALVSSATVTSMGSVAS